MYRFDFDLVGVHVDMELRREVGRSKGPVVFAGGLLSILARTRMLIGKIEDKLLNDWACSPVRRNRRELLPFPRHIYTHAAQMNVIASIQLLR